MKIPPEDCLRSFLSPTRLAEYEAQHPGDLGSALRLHCWNTEVSSAIYEVLQYLEVGLRNAVHTSLSTLSGRADWWQSRKIPLHHVGRDILWGVIEKLARTKPTWTPDTVIANLPFGFWVALFGRHYEHALWYRGLRGAVPGYQGRREPLHQELDFLRTLRNRIAHHRAIYHRHLEADHESMLRVLGYIDGRLEVMVAKHSRVPGLLANRPG